MTINELYTFLKKSIDNGYGNFSPSFIDSEMGNDVTYVIKNIEIDVENKEVIFS